MATGGWSGGYSDSKSGTRVPNNIFVGGLCPSTTEDDLRDLFSKLGNVKATKIILEKSGISRGYGFVTFETEEEAEKALKVQGLTLKDRKLNIAEARKKQPSGRISDSNPVHSPSITWPTQSYSGYSTGFSRDSVYYCPPQSTWPLMYPQQLYYQQQCHYLQALQSNNPPYLYSLAPMDYPYASANAVASSDHSESSSADSNEVASKTRSCKPTSAPSPRYSSSSTSDANYAPPLHHLQQPVFAKTMNGMTVMAYPSSIVMGSPAIVHVRDGATDSENLVTELSFLHSGALTPPPTPSDFHTNIDSIRKK